MIDAVIRWCLKHAFLVILGVGAIVGVGYYALTQTPVDALPDIGEKQVIVYADWPGRSPQDVDNQVTYPLTTSLTGTPGVKTIRSMSGFGFAMVFVSHDLALVAELAHRVTVMYAGQVVEQAPTRDLLLQPVHEYTRGLLGSVLSIESGSQRLHQVAGTVPSPRDFPAGDRFAPRGWGTDAPQARQRDRAPTAGLNRQPFTAFVHIR